MFCGLDVAVDVVLVCLQFSCDFDLLADVVMVAWESTLLVFECGCFCLF